MLINTWLTFIKYLPLIIIANVLRVYYVADTILNTWEVVTHLNLKTTREEGMLLTQSFDRLINGHPSTMMLTPIDAGDTQVNPSNGSISSQPVDSDSSHGWEKSNCLCKSDQSSRSIANHSSFMKSTLVKQAALVSPWYRCSTWLCHLIKLMSVN